MTKPRLLFVYRYCNMGGVASVIKQRFVHLKDQYDFDCAFFIDAGTGASEWQNHGISAFILGKKFEKGLRDLVERNDYHLITVVDTPEAVPVLTSCYHKPLIYEVHTSYFDAIAASRDALSASRCIIVPSNWSRNTLVSRFLCDPDTVHVIPNLVDEDLFRPMPDDSRGGPKRVVWVGKLDENKNWRDAVAVFEAVLRACPSVRFTMLTGGSQTPAVQKEFIAELHRRGLTEAVEHLHHLPYNHMSRIYSEAASAGGVVLSTSLHESFSMVVHEAWRCGLPVVTSNVGPLAETVEHGVTGMLFDPWDVSAATRQVISLIDSSELHQNIARNGRTRAADFNACHTVPKYEALIQKFGRESEIPISLLY